MIANKQTFIHHFLEQSAKIYPDKTALIYEDRRATYTDINNQANSLANWLIDQGVTKGDRVVLILENSLEYVVSYYGALKAGAVVSPFSIDLKPDGLKPLLHDLEPKIVICSTKYERHLKLTDLAALRNSKVIIQNPKLNWSSRSIQIISLEELISNRETLNLELNLDETSLASIIYTSGSTGKPKGVMLSHKNIVSNTHSICQYLGLTEKDIQMVVLPFFYVMGKSLLNTHFAAGGTVVINNKFAYPASVLNQMVEEKITGFSGVPSTYAYLLHRSPLAKFRDKLGTLRYCSQAGGHMSSQIKYELRKVLPSHTQIFIMYGATETSARLTYLEPSRFNEKIDSIGKPIPGVKIRIHASDGTEVSLGETGELVARGSNIMLGYWKDPAATKEVLDNHGYHTGDLSYQDADGFYYIKGRKDDLLKVGGHRINPQEIENVLMKTELVLEAVVFAVPDKLLGNRLFAVVTPISSECNENQVLSRCADKLPRYKLPCAVKIVRTLPKHPSGKIDRTRCLELIK